MTTVLANANLVLANETVEGSVTIEDGKIAAIDQGTTVPAGAIDCGGDYLAPGLIELHTDNLERHMQPRPGVRWPFEAAVIAHDRELASVGVTTVFDALRVGSILSEKNSRYKKYARSVTNVIQSHRTAGHLKISHFVHLRAEVCSETLPEELDEFSSEDRIGIVSLMDHTPGQRQFRDLTKMAEYISGKHGMAADEVDTSTRHGCKIGEFPTTIEAARASHAAGIAVVMGAPNYLRGGSHSGNVSAADLADEGLLDILSSDYAPSSLLMGAVRLGFSLGDLARGMHTVTAAPAKVVGLDDRGTIATGLRADLVRFSLAGDVPAVNMVWSRGERV